MPALVYAAINHQEVTNQVYTQKRAECTILYYNDI